MIHRLAFTIPAMPGEFDHDVPMIVIAPDTVEDLFDIVLPTSLHRTDHKLTPLPPSAFTAGWPIDVDDAWIAAAETYDPTAAAATAKVVVVLDPVADLAPKDERTAEIADHLGEDLPAWALAVLDQRTRAAVRDISVTSGRPAGHGLEPMAPTSLLDWADTTITPQR
ncbi:hypothetical protein [Actinocorallia sp. A-T 12471]|uniref:hypothetical protein n=1 Tax=Actinocorallia sp. A-T 12471 TaxID=3089813 RepID=UPI0029D34FEC|nr:hypothetical protein [Actinocorallia sp. A-T 12471]MDX6740152.1 hypothetical protein [Actinocorallia sp. A-T 12471]